MVNWNCFISHEKNLLLINFFDLKDTKYANNFLFNLLFTKCFRNGENIYYLSKNIKIVIELSYSFNYFKSKLFIIEYFNIDTIHLNNMPLIEQNEKELILKLNIICTYFYYLENDKINEERIIISPLEGEK